MKKILIFVMILILTAWATGCGSAKHTASGGTAADLTAKEETSPAGMDAGTAGKETEPTTAAVTKEDPYAEYRIYGKKADGITENYPDQVLPIYKMKELLNSEGNSWGVVVDYETSASFEEAADYYRELLRDKDGFEEKQRSDETFHCRTSDWFIHVDVKKIFGGVQVYLELDSLTWEDNPYLELHEDD